MVCLEQMRKRPGVANQLQERMRGVVLALSVVALTFSYAILKAILPSVAGSAPVIRMACWALLILSIYSGFAWVTTGHVAAQSLCWRMDGRGPVGAAAAAVLLAGLAVLFPSPEHSWLDMLYIVAVGVIEAEILFRGLIWDVLDDSSGRVDVLGLRGTAWLTSLAFGVMHLQYHVFLVHQRSIVQMSYSFAVGVGLGAMCQRTASVWSAVLAHSAFNSLLNLCLTVFSLA